MYINIWDILQPKNLKREIIKTTLTHLYIWLLVNNYGILYTYLLP